MKTTMRDKVCQLIGKYQYLEDFYKTKAAIKADIDMQKVICGRSFIIQPEEIAQADMCSQFLADLKSLLEEDEAPAAPAAPADPRKTAPAGKWCADSAAQAADSAAKEAWIALWLIGGFGSSKK